jgi:hypothetical protein
MEELLNAIKDLIRDKGLSEKQFASNIGLDPAAWSRKKRGLTKFTKDDLDSMVIVYPELKFPVWHSIGKTGANK